MGGDKNLGLKHPLSPIEAPRFCSKEHSGFVEVYDSLVNPLDKYKYDHQKFNNKIIDLNRFYK